MLRDCKSARKKWSTGDRADNFFFVKGAVKNKLIFIKKNAEFYADFKFVDAGFHKCT